MAPERVAFKVRLYSEPMAITTIPMRQLRHLGPLTPNLRKIEANSIAWHNGVALLKTAIQEKLDYSFESTLGANTIPGLLRDAANGGFNVRVWYVGLSSPELHISRVRRRVSRGGHPISESDIRRRYDASRANLINLIPHLTGFKVFAIALRLILTKANHRNLNSSYMWNVDRF